MSFGHNGATMHSCEFCGEGFYMRRQLKLHLRSKHSCTKPFGCKICPRRFVIFLKMDVVSEIISLWIYFRFTLRSALRLHTLLHQRQLHHPCTICGRKFKQGTQFRAHLRTHYTEKPYQCDLCHKRFQRLAGLKVHSIKKHTLDFPFYCELCFQGFVNITSLRSHLKTCRLDSEMPPPRKVNKKSFGGRRGRPKKEPDMESNQCQKCGKCFAYRNGLRVHQRVHSGDKPFQ